MKKILLLIMFLLCGIFSFSATAKAKIISSMDELPSSVKVENGKVTTPTIKGYCGQKVKDIKFPENGWYWIIDNATLNKTLKAGTTITVKGLYMPNGQFSTATMVNVPITVSHKLKCTPYKSATSTKAGNYTYYTCLGCGRYYNAHKKPIKKYSWIIPVIPTSRSVVMGRTVDVSKLITDGGNAFVRMSVKDSYKNYISISGRKLKIINKFTSGLPNTIPVYIAMKSCNSSSGIQYYRVNLKVTPDITITKTAINGGAKYKYAFTYNFVGATKVKVRLKEGGNASSDRLLDARVSDICSNANSYLIVQDWKLNELGGKITFLVTVYYGNGKTVTRTITK